MVGGHFYHSRSNEVRNGTRCRSKFRSVGRLYFFMLNFLFSFLLIHDRVSLIFGAIVILAGITGTWFGSFAGQKLRKRHPTADALLCAWGMVLAG